MGGWFKMDQPADAWLLSHDNAGWDRTLLIDSRPKTAKGPQWAVFTGDEVIGVKPLEIHQWAFFVMRHDQSKGRLVVNIDQNRVSRDATYYKSGNRHLTLGHQPNFNGPPRDVYLDNVFVYDTFLSDSDIETIRTHGRLAILPPSQQATVDLATIEPLTRLNTLSNPRDGDTFVSKAEKKSSDGFVTLFQDKSFKGWYFEGGADWEFEADGTLKGSGPWGLLTSVRDDYKDFHLRCLVSISKDGRSDIFFRRQFAPECSHILSYHTQIFGLIKSNGRRTGNLVVDDGLPLPNPGEQSPETDLASGKSDNIQPEKPFLLELIVVGNKIKILIDGNSTVDYFDSDYHYARGSFSLFQPFTESVVRYHKVEIKEFKRVGESSNTLLRHPTAPNIPSDASSFHGKRYKVYRDRLGWHQARIKCEELGGSLAIVRSREENQFLTSLLEKEGLGTAWLGATDEMREGRWLWVDHSEMTYKNWNVREPSNLAPQLGIPEHYLTIDVSANGAWNDHANIGTTGYICQWNHNTKVDK